MKLLARGDLRFERGVDTEVKRDQKLRELRLSVSRRRRIFNNDSGICLP